MGCYSVLLAMALLPNLGAADKQDALRVEVAAALKRFYEDRLDRPFLRDPDDPEKKPAPLPWDAPLKKLKAGKPDEQSDAVAFLRELLSQALEHETSRKAPWRSTPFWGGGAELPARDLRKEIAGELAKEVVEVFGREKEVAEIARKHPRAADQVAPLKAWLQEQLKEK